MLAVHVDWLKHKVPLDHLSEDKLQKLSQRVVVSEYRRKAVIVDYGDDDTLTPFLVMGAVRITTNDGKTMEMRHSDESARYGLVNIRPSNYRIVALKNNTLVCWVKSAIVTKINDRVRRRP